MAEGRLRPWTAPLLGALLLGCGGTPYEPTPERLLGTFSGHAGTGFDYYGFELTVTDVSDSVRGSWYLGFTATCASHNGPFRGILDGDRLHLRLEPDQVFDLTLAIELRVLPGDSVLVGRPTLVSRGEAPADKPAFCTSDTLDAVMLHAVPAAAKGIQR